MEKRTEFSKGENYYSTNYSTNDRMPLNENKRFWGRGEIYKRDNQEGKRHWTRESEREERKKITVLYHNCKVIFKITKQRMLPSSDKAEEFTSKMKWPQGTKQ